MEYVRGSMLTVPALTHHVIYYLLSAFSSVPVYDSLPGTFLEVYKVFWGALTNSLHLLWQQRLAEVGCMEGRVTCGANNRQ